MATISCLPKQYRKAHKLSRKQGWVWKEQKKHIGVYTPEGVFVVEISTTMYDGPLTKKHLSALRKANCPGVC